MRRAAALLAAAAVLGGCGGAKRPSPRPQAASPTATATALPPTLALSDCDEWRELRPASRLAFVEQLRLFFGAKVNDTYGRGQTLPTEQALAVLDNGCRPAYAGAVKLYKIYGRAAAFTP